MKANIRGNDMEFENSSDYIRYLSENQISLSETRLVVETRTKTQRSKIPDEKVFVASKHQRRVEIHYSDGTILPGERYTKYKLVLPNGATAVKTVRYIAKKTLVLPRMNIPFLRAEISVNPNEAKRTELIYSDGSIQVRHVQGRYATHLENGATLVEVKKYIPEKAKREMKIKREKIDYEKQIIFGKESKRTAIYADGTEIIFTKRGRTSVRNESGSPLVLCVTMKKSVKKTYKPRRIKEVLDDGTESLTEKQLVLAKLEDLVIGKSIVFVPGKTFEGSESWKKFPKRGIFLGINEKGQWLVERNTDYGVFIGSYNEGVYQYV